jgi:small subunit ribosomal protein S21
LELTCCFAQQPKAEGGVFHVTKVRVKSDEPFEKALRRFKKKCNKEGLMQRLKEVKFHEKPSEARRRRLAKAVARSVQEDQNT